MRKTRCFCPRNQHYDSRNLHAKPVFSILAAMLHLLCCELWGSGLYSPKYTCRSANTLLHMPNGQLQVQSLVGTKLVTLSTKQITVPVLWLWSTHKHTYGIQKSIFKKFLWIFFPYRCTKSTNRVCDAYSPPVSWIVAQESWDHIKKFIWFLN